MNNEASSIIDKTRVEPIVLDDAYGWWVFEPRPDVTALESALIAQLFVAMTLRRTRLDWREYLTRDWGKNLKFDPPCAIIDAKVDLARHFKEASE